MQQGGGGATGTIVLDDPVEEIDWASTSATSADLDLTITIGPVNVIFVGGQPTGFAVYDSQFVPKKNPAGTGGLKAAGIAGIGARNVYVLSRAGDEPGDVLETLAHEIGHVMIGPGHPGIPHPGDGVAGLSGTDQKKRLMYGGFAEQNPNEDTLLVKGEWDYIEQWLTDVVD
jgi:hypothetical protein